MPRPLRARVPLPGWAAAPHAAPALMPGCPTVHPTAARRSPCCGGGGGGSQRAAERCLVAWPWHAPAGCRNQQACMRWAGAAAGTSDSRKLLMHMHHVPPAAAASQAWKQRQPAVTAPSGRQFASNRINAAPGGCQGQAVRRECHGRDVPIMPPQQRQSSGPVHRPVDQAGRRAQRARQRCCAARHQTGSGSILRTSQAG